MYIYYILCIRGFQAHMHGVCETTKNRNDTTWEGFVTEQLTEIVEGLQDHVKRALDSSG